MTTPLSMTCSASYAECASRRARRAEPNVKTTLGMRVLTLALALSALYAMYSGERWLLERPAATTNELVVATCVVDAVLGNPDLPSACTSPGPGHEEESAP
jgi:hypothetical protein